VQARPHNTSRRHFSTEPFRGGPVDAKSVHRVKLRDKYSVGIIDTLCNSILGLSDQKKAAGRSARPAASPAIPLASLLLRLENLLDLRPNPFQV
jgi:hypothetical protein